MRVMVPTSLFHLQPFDADSLSAAFVDFDYHAMQHRVLACRLIANRQPSHKARDHQLRLNANHAVVRPGHPKVGYVACAAGEYLFIRSLNVSVSAYDYRDPSIK